MLPYGVVLSFAALYAYTLTIVARTAINVPIQDDWRNLPPRHFQLAWFFQRLNEHYIVLTKVLIWILYEINGWNIAQHVVINFLIYGALLGCIAWFGRRSVPDLPTWVVVAFLVFLLSPIDFENHIEATATQWHLVFLLLFVALPLLFEPRQRPRSLAMAALCLVLTIYTIAQGWTCGLVALVSFAVFKLRRGTACETAADRHRELLQLAMAVLVLMPALGLWWIGYAKPSDIPAQIPPWQGGFWSFFINLLSWGFGYGETNNLYNFIYLFIVLAPTLAVACQIWRSPALEPGTTTGQANHPSPVPWALLTAILCVLAAVASITYGRDGFSDLLLGSKASRYSETAMMLVPLCVMACSQSLRLNPRLLRLVIPALWFFCYISFQDRWDYDSFQMVQVYHQAARNYVRAYYQHNGSGAYSAGYCNALNPYPIPDRLRQARLLNLSFTRP